MSDHVPVTVETCDRVEGPFFHRTRAAVDVGAELAPGFGSNDETDKRFPGNPTRSYRSRAPLRVVGEVRDWQGHAPEVLDGMLALLQRLRERGLDVIED